MASEPAVALVMAAGRSRRFGRDKRLEPLPDGRTLLQTTLALARRHFARTCVVIRADDRPAILGLPADVDVIRAPAGESGLGDSIGAAFHYLLETERRAAVAAVLLADMPWLEGVTLERLIERADSSLIVRPVCRQCPGHPVLFGRSYWRELAALVGEKGARNLLAEHADAVVRVAVDDPGCVRDIDRPQDLQSR